MIPELGLFALTLAFALAGAQTLLCIWGRKDVVMLRAGQAASGMLLLAVCAAFAALVWAFAVSDFSVANVAANSHSTKPMLDKIAGAWGSHEGSMLLWTLILALYGFAASCVRMDGPLKAWTLASQGLLAMAFLAFMLFSSNPLARLGAVPLQGQSLNPLLQDPALALHPPLLYGGYVGFSIVFGFAVAALITRTADAAWARTVRPFALVAWVSLTLGIALGSFWAYYELGWGGWWFWDPVENASLLPWLAGTALLHALAVLEKRGLFPGWAVFLSLLAFTFALLGTFLVRSGVLTSVHAFALDPARGYAVLAMVAAFAGGGFTLFGLRAPQLAGKPAAFALMSREGMLMINNLILSSACFAVLIGTLYPLLLEGLTGKSVSVGAPYFNAVFTPLMACLLVIVPLGVAMPWRKGRVDAWKRLMPALIAALSVLALSLWRFGMTQTLLAFGLALGGWVIVATLLDLKTRAHGTLTASVLAMSLAHLGLGVFVIGAVAETGLKVETTAQLPKGASLDFQGGKLTLNAVAEHDGPNYVAARGVLTWSRDAKPDLELLPERRFYPASNQTTTEVAIRPTGIGVVYVALGEPRMVDGKPAWSVRAAWHPLIGLVYGGCILMALGGISAFAARPRKFP